MRLLGSAPAGVVTPRRLLGVSGAVGCCALIAALAVAPVQGRSQASRPTARALFGRLSSPLGRTNESVARRFLANHVALLGLRRDTRDLALAREFRSPLGSHFLFAQRFEGVPVYGAVTAVHFDRSGRVIALSNGYQPSARVGSVRAEVSRANALGRVRARLGSGRGEAGLVLYRFKGG